MRAASLISMVLVWAAGGVPAAGQDASSYRSRIRPFLSRHCIDCHGEDVAKRDFRLDTLKPDFAARESAEAWGEVLKKLEAGEMPPKKKKRPPAGDLAAVVKWIDAGLRGAEEASRKTEGRVVLRRLNRVEYENTISDLLAVDVELSDLLPEDSVSHGFDNIGEALSISAVLMERYLEAADVALDEAIVPGPRPKLYKKRFDLRDESQIKRRIGRFVRDLGDALVFFNSRYSPSTLRRCRVPVRGKYRFRISAYGYQSHGKPVTMVVYAGGLSSRSGKSRLVGFFDVPEGKPTGVEFVELLDPRGTIKTMGYGLGQRQIQKASEFKGAGLAVQWIEVEGPLHDSWPPESHRRLFGKTDLKAGALKDAERILREFIPRAFRRPVGEGKIAPYLDLVRSRLDAKVPFVDALRVGLKAVLCSPDFLFLRERPGRLDDYALASRLSYFFWSSMPDRALLDLAKAGRLHEPGVLRGQVERMLKDPKARAFTGNFIGQWLDLREIDFTTPDRRLYPEYDELLKVSMVKETERFFDEILRNDLSVLAFIDSDFSMLNGRMALHYGIDGVEGQEFRKVKLPPGGRRGGVLTHASVLKVTANGTFTSPILRGVWVLENILGTPPDPPPPSVPAIEPDTRGATTIREQLAKHRQVPSCAACHSKIDPPGFALESFDVIGGWRDWYRSMGQGKRLNVQVNGRRVGYRRGPDVDASDELPGGRKFSGIQEFKKLLLEDREQVVRCIAGKLLVYATGGSLGWGERRELDGIVRRIAAKNYGLRTLIHEIVRSRAFLRK